MFGFDNLQNAILFKILNSMATRYTFRFIIFNLNHKID